MARHVSSSGQRMTCSEQRGGAGAPPTAPTRLLLDEWSTLLLEPRLLHIDLCESSVRRDDSSSVSLETPRDDAAPSFVASVRSERPVVLRCDAPIGEVSSEQRDR